MQKPLGPWGVVPALQEESVNDPFRELDLPALPLTSLSTRGHGLSSLGLFFSSPCYKGPAKLADESLGCRTVGLNLK